LFSICLSADLDAQRLSNQAFKGRRMPRGRPQLKLSISTGTDLQKRVLTAVVKVDAREALGMAPIEAFSQSENGG
jgi:hypothetical protein